jgi:hypothetical protein
VFIDAATYFSGTSAAASRSSAGNGFAVGSAYGYSFSSTTGSNGAADIGLFRASASVLNLTNGSSGFSILQLGGLVVPKTSGTGIKVDTTTPTWGWKDITGAITTRTGGGTAPAYAAYRANIYQWSFGVASGTVEVFNEYHIPHDYLPSTATGAAQAMHIHPHISTAAAPTGTVNFLFDIVYAKGYDQAVFEGTVGSGAPITVSATQAMATAFRHYIPEVQFAAPNGLISFNAAATFSITSGAATLTSSASAFAASDIGTTVRIVGAGVAGADLDTTITAYTNATQVTVAVNASTTVSAVTDAAKRRVLDIANIEVDGVVLVRTWRDASRTADTLDVAPFLHLVDCHVQTTGIAGTKQKNGPAFYT